MDYKEYSQSMNKSILYLAGEIAKMSGTDERKILNDMTIKPLHIINYLIDYINKSK